MGPSEQRAGGWRVVIAYAGVCAATQVLWLSYAAITSESARRYGVSSGAIGWLAEIFPLLYVLLALPSGMLLDRWFRPVLAASGLLVAAGGLVRLGGETFGWALAGQIMVAVAQPVAVSAVSKLAGQYLPPRQRPAGIALGAGAGFLGMLLALLLGPTVGGHGHLQRLLVLEAVIGVVPGIALAAALLSPGGRDAEQAAIESGAARSLWRDSRVRALCGLAFVGFGIFVALATWLQTLLEPDGVSESTAGALLVGMVLAGTIACATLPQRFVGERVEQRFLRGAVTVALAGCAALSVIRWLPARAAVLAVMGAALLPALPVILTAIERLAGAAAGTAGALVWLAGNLGGLMVALLVQALVNHELVAFLALAAVAALGYPSVARLRPRLGG